MEFNNTVIVKTLGCLICNLIYMQAGVLTEFRLDEHYKCCDDLSSQILTKDLSLRIYLLNSHVTHIAFIKIALPCKYSNFTAMFIFNSADSLVSSYIGYCLMTMTLTFTFRQDRAPLNKDHLLHGHADKSSNCWVLSFYNLK